MVTHEGDTVFHHSDDNRPHSGRNGNLCIGCCLFLPATDNVNLLRKGMIEVDHAPRGKCLTRPEN